MGSKQRKLWAMRLRDDERAQFDQAAMLSGLPPRTWARVTLLQAADNLMRLHAALATPPTIQLQTGIMEHTPLPDLSAPTPITPRLVPALSPAKPIPRPLLAQPKGKRS